MTRRVLYFPHDFRREFFHGFAAHVVQEAGWTLGVVCKPQIRDLLFAKIGDRCQYFVLPEFSKKASWEREPAAVQRIQSLIESCEELTGVSVNRFLLAAERDLGPGYRADAYNYPETDLSRRSAKGAGCAHRTIERMFHHAVQVIEEFEPDCLIFGNTSPAENLAFSMVTEHKAIPFFLNRASKLHSGRCYWTRDRWMLNDATRHAFERRSASNESVSARAIARLDELRAKPEPIDYVKANWKKTDSKRAWIPTHAAFARRLATQLRYVLGGRRGATPKSALVGLADFYRRKYLWHRLRGFLATFDEAELAGMKYIYYPFHKEPELAINFQAYLWHDQRNTIKLLSSMLPRGVRLLVREHRRTWGRRPTRYLKVLIGYPGVTVIDPFDSQYKYIQHAGLIITDNGSSGWEGLIMGRPVIVLHENFYDVAGLARHIRDIDRLNSEILKVFRSPPPVDVEDRERRLGLLLDAEWESSLPDDPDHYADNARAVEDLLDSVKGGQTSAQALKA